MAAKKKKAVRRKKLHSLGSATSEHAKEVKDALLDGRKHLAEFYRAIDNRGACRAIGKDRGAYEALSALTGAVYRAGVEAWHGGITYTANQSDRAVMALNDELDKAKAEFARRCVRVSPDVD